MLVAAGARQDRRRVPQARRDKRGAGTDGAAIGNPRGDPGQDRGCAEDQRPHDLRDEVRQNFVKRQNGDAAADFAIRRGPPQGGPRRAVVAPIRQQNEAARESDDTAGEGECRNVELHRFRRLNEAIRRFIDNTFVLKPSKSD